MSAEDQTGLRDDICDLVMARVEAGSVTMLQAAVACFGAAAIAAAALHPEVRRELVGTVEADIANRVEMRAEQIRSGALDAHLDARRRH